MADDILICSASERPIDAVDVRRLYDGANWWPGWEPESIRQAVRSSMAVGAWDGTRLVGFARALTDGVHRAYVEDVVIDPMRRGSGVGERLVAALIQSLGDVHIVSLFCEPERVVFYMRNGFRPSESQVMMHRDTTSDGTPGQPDREV